MTLFERGGERKSELGKGWQECSGRRLNRKQNQQILLNQVVALWHSASNVKQASYDPAKEQIHTTESIHTTNRHHQNRSNRICGEKDCHSRRRSQDRQWLIQGNIIKVKFMCQCAVGSGGRLLQASNFCARLLCRVVVVRRSFGFRTTAQRSCHHSLLFVVGLVCCCYSTHRRI